MIAIRVFIRALPKMAERTGLEPATPGVTGRYSNQLNYRSTVLYCDDWWVLTGSNRRHSPCKGDALPAELSTRHERPETEPAPRRVGYFIASLRALPALNAGVLLALILICSLVLGFRPIRALRSRTMNVPKPTTATLSFFF